MDALIPALVAVLLAEMGGHNQAIAHRAAVAGVAPSRVVAALLVTLAIGLGLAAAGGSLIAYTLPPDARLLLASLALVFAGVPMLLPSRKLKTEGAGNVAVSFFARQFGDSAQFIVFALAARGDMPALAATGGMAGASLAVLPPLLLAHDWPGQVPVRAIRLVAATLLIVAGLILAVQALRLI